MWRDFWKLAIPYWRSHDRGRTIALTLLAAVMGLANTYILTKMTEAQGEYGNALQDRNAGAFAHGVESWMAWVSVWIFGSIYASYFQRLVGLRWREWMTRQYLETWLADRTFYYWRFAGAATDNPDQRIAEDIRGFIDGTIDLTLGALASLSLLVTYVVILWRLSSGMTLPIGGHAVAIPGYLVWAAILWSAAFTGLMHKVGRPLVSLRFRQQRFEADFRFGLIRVRENTESIALLRGEPAEKASLAEHFGRIVTNVRAIMKLDLGIDAVDRINNDIGANLYIFLAAPLFFRGLLKIGGLFQIRNAFGIVQSGFTYVVGAYGAIAEWTAVIQRLTEFQRTSDAARQIAESQPLTGKGEPRVDTLSVANLSLSLPNGQTLARDISLTLVPGDSLLVTGASGVGKSTLLRAIAGIWPYTAGSIRLPADFNAADGMLILPQHPYLPVGTLRSALTYPADPAKLATTNWAELLAKLHLDHLLPRLDDDENWSQILSGGEQQRVALARVFIHRPRWLFLDEATSALDEPSEAAITAAIRAELPGTAILSIGHRSSLAVLHGRVFVMEGDQHPVVDPSGQISAG